MTNRMPQNTRNPDVVLPPRPSILVNIQQEMAKIHADLHKIAELIAGDLVLAAEILKTVNSPFYGLQIKVTSTVDAVKMLGFTRTSQLVAAISVRQSVPLPAELNYFWDDMTGLAIMEASITKHLHLNADMAYLMGLFHDCAVPLMAAKFPDYLKVRKGFKDISVIDAENDQYAMNHAQLGSLFARAWYLPDPLIQAIRYHHHDSCLFNSNIGQDALTLIAIHMIVDNIQDTLVGNAPIDYPQIKPKIMEFMDLDDDQYQILTDIALDSINEVNS
jgi:HD-like signal output (HDOD) protein